MLSARQDYTDQALDAIRSRLLNGKAAVGGSTPPRPRGHVGSFDAAATAAAPAWSPIKRENPGPVVSASAAESGVLVRQRFPPPSASSPLQLFQLSRSLTGAAVSGPIAHPLQRPIVRIGGPESGLSASSGVTDPDEKEEEGTRSFGLRSGQFSGQKIERRFDGISEDRSPGSDQKTYSCGFCRKAFLFKSKYQEHLPVHTSARPFECNLCARTYKYKYDLRVHLRSHLGIPTKSTTCPFCAEKFATNKLMRSHVKETHREPRQVDEEQGTTAPESASSV